MPLQITMNPRPAGNLSIAANQRARFSSVVSLDWDHVTGKPAVLDALGDVATAGMLALTDASDGDISARTLTGTANQITVTNGDGVAGAPTFSLPADVLIPTVVTVPNTGLHILDTNASHDLIIAAGSNLTADHTLTLTTGDADRTVTLAGNLTTAADLITSGANSLTLTTTASTNVTFPTTGTLATLAGTEELDNKTLDSSVGKGTWTASGTWTLPAYTLGGTVSGGGNEINNVKIGTTTPLAGAFTTLSASSTVTVTAGNVTIGSGGTSPSRTLILNGGSNANNGAYMAFQKAGASQWAIGHHSAIAGGGSTSDDFLWYGPGGLVMRLGASGSLLSGGGSFLAHYNTAIPAGGTAGAGLLVSSTSNFGVFFGSGAPSLSAAKGSLYLRSDGSSTSTRMYVNTDGSTTWTNVTTAA